MIEDRLATVAVLTDLWPSASEPWSGSFVRAQVEALENRFRHVVVVPRLVCPGVHDRIWGRRGVQGWQRRWVPPRPPARLLRYPMLRVPRVGEAGMRVLGVRAGLAVARERPSLVHGHFLHEVGVAAVRAAAALGVPSVVTVHGTDGRWLVDGGIQERFRGSMLEAAGEVDRLIVVEQGLADALVAAGVAAERVSVIPMGVDEHVFFPRPRGEARRALGLDPDDRVVVFVGRGTVAKGVDVLDRALGLLGPGVRGAVVGPAYTSFDCLEVVGPQQPKQVALWLAASDVFCLPSFAEGTPVSVLEALACGRPVVASAVGGIPRQVQHGVNGLLVPAGDSEALAKALGEALAGDWSEEQLRSSSEPFWWSVTAPRIAAVYEQLLRR